MSPRGNPEYTKRLDFFVSEEMRSQIIAISYFMETKGKHAPVCRNLLNTGIQFFLKGLPPKQRKEYDFIMSRVKTLE